MEETTTNLEKELRVKLFKIATEFDHPKFLEMVDLVKEYRDKGLSDEVIENLMTEVDNSISRIFHRHLNREI